MESTALHITQKDGYQTRLFCYETSKETVLGNVLLLHGMAEHHGRYLNFIQTLLQEGFDVYAYDHRGHGTDKKLSELGFITPKNGAALLVSDAITLCRYIKEHGRSEKLAVFGHSMGSLVLRNLIRHYNEFDCAIVASSTMPPRFISLTGLLITNLVCLFSGSKKRIAFLDKMMFGGKEYTSLCTRTSFDWLTRNNTMVGKYIDDPYCGFLCTTSFYRDLTTLAFRCSGKKNISNIRRDFPVLFLAGDKDPVGGYATQIVKLHRLFTSLGFQKAELKVYPDARHELLNELNYEEVTADIISYLHSNLD